MACSRTIAAAQQPLGPSGGDRGALLAWFGTTRTLSFYCESPSPRDPAVPAHLAFFFFGPTPPPPDPSAGPPEPAVDHPEPAANMSKTPRAAY